MSLDSSTGSIAVLAPPNLQAELQQIIAMLQTKYKPAMLQTKYKPDGFARRESGSAKLPDGSWYLAPPPARYSNER